MYLIARQPYSKVERVISSAGQQHIKHQRMMYMYEEEIVTQYHTFPLEIVNDVSFRKINGSGGLLYLHTMKGVFTYMVAQPPYLFIQAFKNHVNRW
ncbi:hypothetical protein [Virgibacillus halodenitrificans]|jgi:hypothetical protein|uniref:hypothetical protein n=2 Tax=Virgibacillus halodenitrificans TaxID=1482 RepID=UPI000EF512FE|nr:hypothetical protein [Virgibacillus halodenitrificans]